MIKFLFITVLALTICMTSTVHALPYQTCVSEQQSGVCKIAFAKLKTLRNPVTKQLFFHDGTHIQEDGTLFMFPTLYVATPDLDGDGKPEIIVSVPEATDEDEGLYCIQNVQCPHYIIQDRTLPDQKRTLNTFKAIGPIYAYAVALSTDERYGTFKSLRAYYDETWKNFDVYQYDAQTDRYYNVSVKP